MFYGLKVTKIHEAVSEFCHIMAEKEQRGYAQAAWFENHGKEQVGKELEKEKFAVWFGKAQELGYTEDDITVYPYISTHGAWWGWVSVNLIIDIFGEYSSIERFHFPQNSELPKAFIAPFLERERKEAEERAAIQAKKEASQKAERERLEAEKLSWIAEHGSDYLQRATALDYNCQRQYVTERATIEFPDYTVDFDDNASWNDRACPSLVALEEVERLIKAGHNAKVVWLTEPVEGIKEEEDYEYSEETYEASEAVVIRDYLGKYNLVREF